MRGQVQVGGRASQFADFVFGGGGFFQQVGGSLTVLAAIQFLDGLDLTESAGQLAKTGRLAAPRSGPAASAD